MCDGLGWIKIVRVGKKSGPVLSRLWTKVHGIFGQCRRPFVLSSPLPDCLCHISFRRYSPLSVEVIEKLNKCKSFLAPIFPGGTTPTVLQHTVSVIYHPLFGKVWLSSVCWSPFVKPGNEAECRICRGWVKMQVGFEAVCGPKFMTYWDDVGDPL